MMGHITEYYCDICGMQKRSTIEALQGIRQMKCCPTCLRPLPPQVRVGGKRRQALLDYVLKHPEGVTNPQILSHVWADDPNGGPDYSQIVSVMVRKINLMMDAKGVNLRIRGSGGPGSVYRAVYL